MAYLIFRATWLGITHSVISRPEMVAACGSWILANTSSATNNGTSFTCTTRIRAHHVRRLATPVVMVITALPLPVAANLPNAAGKSVNDLLRAVHSYLLAGADGRDPGRLVTTSAYKCMGRQSSPLETFIKFSIKGLSPTTTKTGSSPEFMLL
jgi:hypothetical protein